MTKNEFRKIQKILSIAIAQAEKEAIDEGVDVRNKEYDEALLILKEKLLNEMGLTTETYEELRKSFKIPKKPISYKELVDTPLPPETLSQEDVEEMIEESIEKIPKPTTTIINKIEKETIKEKPQIIVERVKEVVKELDNEELDELKKNIQFLQEALHDFKIPEYPVPRDWSKEINELRWDFDNKLLKGNVNKHTTADVGSFNNAILDSRYYKKPEVDALIGAENLWDRTGTTLSPHTSGDSVALGTGNITANNLAITNWNTAYGWGNHAGLYLPITTVLPSNEAGASNNFLTAYNSTTGAFSKSRPTWANIDKATSSLVDITTRNYSDLSGLPTLGTWSTINYPTWSSGTPFVKMTAAGTFALDTNTYLTSLSGALLATGTVAGGTSQSQTFNSALIVGATTDPSNGQDILYSRGVKYGVVGNKYSSGNFFFGSFVKANTTGAGYLSATTANVGRGAVEIGSLGGVGGIIAFYTGAIQTSTDGGAVTIAEIARFSDLHKALLIGTTTDATSDLLQVNGGILGTGLTISGLTSGRVPYLTTGGLFTSSEKLTFDGDQLAMNSPATSVPFSVTMPAASNGYWTFSRAAGYTAGFILRTNGANPNRWLLAINSDSESGSNAGSNFSIYPCDDSGNTGATAFFIQRSTGNVGIKMTPTYPLDVTGDIRTSTLLRTPEIKTDTSTPTDLTITTGAAKTLSLATNVYEDLQFPTGSGKVPAVNTPTWEALTTNISAYSFTVNDYMDLQSAEVPHNWVEGTAGDLHLHFAIKTAQNTGANRYAKFTIYVVLADSTTSGKETWTELTAFTAEYTIPTGSGALKSFYLDMGDITLTGYKIGTQVKVRVKRIAATGGTEYADNVFITQVGVHLQRNTIGSRNETTK